MTRRTDRSGLSARMLDRTRAHAATKVVAMIMEWNARMDISFKCESMSSGGLSLSLSPLLTSLSGPTTPCPLSLPQVPRAKQLAWDDSLFAGQAFGDELLVRSLLAV